MNEHRRQIRGKLYLTPSNGDLYTFLNQVVRLMEAHDSYFEMVWANAYVQPYREEFDQYLARLWNLDVTNVLILKVRGIGMADDAHKATDALNSIIASAAEQNGINVNGSVEFTAWEVMNDD